MNLCGSIHLSGKILAQVVRTAIVLGVIQPAFATDPNERLNEHQVPTPPILPAHPLDPFQLPPVKPEQGPEPAATSGSIMVDKITFTGNLLMPSQDLAAIAAPYLHRSLTGSDIDSLRQKLTQHYVDLGYINSGALLDANAYPVSDHSLRYTLVEGRLTAIRIKGLGRLNPDYITSRLGGAPQPLNINNLRERFQIVLADPLIAQMNAAVTPGDALGEANLDLNVVRAPDYQLTTTFNNYRPPSIGAESIGLSGTARDLTGQGDILELSEETPIQGAGRIGEGLHWRMPLIQHSTDLLVLYDRGDSSVTEEPVTVLGIRSLLVSKGIGFDQLLVDTLSQHLSLEVLRFGRENRTSLLGQPFSFIPGEPSGDTVAPAWRFIQNYSYRDLVQVLAVRSTFSFVSDNQDSGQGLPPSVVPGRDYSIWLGQAQYVRQVLDNGAEVVVRGTVQTADRHVLPLDSLSIGGDTTVRGFRENQLLSDRGEVLNLEFNYPIYTDQNRGIKIAAIPFYDIGQGRSVGVQPITVSDAGLAARLNWRSLQFDISKAVRLSYPRNQIPGGGSLQDRGIYFQLQYTVFSN
jgi:hemolysin activation/secretion protein